MKPVIAMPKLDNSLFRIYMKSQYVFSLHKAGAKVRWVDLTDPDRAAEEVVKYDGLLLPGGPDLEPSLYGQERQECCEKADALRDAGEMKMLTAFLKTRKPILCICRGVQLLNAHQGGTLHQDITPMQKHKHSDFDNRHNIVHSVDLTVGSQTAEIFGKSTLQVNSMHHQAADMVAPTLLVGARSDDGFIEGLEMPDHPFCIGLQWHPEHMRHDAIQQKIFRAFVDACK